MNANANPLNVVRNRLAAVYLLLIEAAEKNTAPDSVSQADSDAATEAQQSARPAHYATRRRAGQTERDR